MKVLIVARTRMSGASRCIGGLAEDGSAVRLLTATGENPDSSTPFQIGQFWELSYVASPQLIEPHIEDVRVTARRHIGDQTHLRTHLLQRVTPWRGDIDLLFGGLVSFTWKNNGYVCRLVGVPDRSTGFWIPDRDLELRDDRKHYDYVMERTHRGLVYVGEETVVNPIPAGTLVRVSLARWWRQDDATPDFEKRCYLQLSGWY